MEPPTSTDTLPLLQPMDLSRYTTLYNSSTYSPYTSNDRYQIPPGLVQETTSLTQPRTLPLTPLHEATSAPPYQVNFEENIHSSAMRLHPSPSYPFTQKTYPYPINESPYGPIITEPSQDACPRIAYPYPQPLVMYQGDVPRDSWSPETGDMIVAEEPVKERERPVKAKRRHAW